MIPGKRLHITEARRAAKEQGKGTYEGRPCKHHPENVTRWTVNGCCCLCTKEKTKPYRERNKNKLREKRKEWDRKNPVKSMLQRARRRAREFGLEFDLKPENVVIPDSCPVLGIPLDRFGGDLDSIPSLDRIDNSKGYVPGNVVVVSFRANRIKGNSTIEELRKVAEYYERYLCESN